MKFLFDLFPVLLFFATFKTAEKSPESAAALIGNLMGSAVADVHQAPILLATVVVILATLGQILWVKLRHGRVEKMLWFSLALVAVFGGLTLIFQNENFIKWKPTILYWSFATGMAASSLFWGRNTIEGMLAEQVKLPPAVWQRLNLAWIAFFAFMGAANLYIAFNFPTDTWVNFKLFGGMGLMLVFILLQGVVLSRYMEENK